MKKGCSQNVPKFAGKHLSQRLSFNKVAGLSISKLNGKYVWSSLRISVDPIFKILPLSQIENTPKVNILRKVVSKPKYEGFFYNRLDKFCKKGVLKN